jgi:hypothetical protein
MVRRGPDRRLATAALSVLTLVGFGCGGATTQPTAAVATPAVAQHATIGDSLTLAGGNERLTVRPLAVVDPASVGSAFVRPQPGDRYVAVVVRLTNVAESPYDDSPANGAVLTTADGRFYAPTFGPAGHPLGTPRLPSHESTLGLLTFEIPAGVALRQFRLTLASGFGHATGEWTIPPGAHPSTAQLGAAGLGPSASGVGRTLVISGNIGRAEVAVTPHTVTRHATQIRVALTAQNVGNVPSSISDEHAPGSGLRLTLVDAHGTAISATSIAMPAIRDFHEYAPLNGVATFDVPAGFVPATLQAVVTEGGVQAAVWRLAAD